MTNADDRSHDSTVGIFTVDTRLVVQTWDPWMSSATGIPAAAALGRLLSEVVPGIDDRGLLVRLREVLEHGTVEVLSPALHQYLIACAPRTPSARFDHMQQYVTIGPLRRDHSVVGVVVTVEDVTARLESERALAASSESLGHALDDPQWAVRQQNVRRLATQGDDAIVATLVETLRAQHHNFNVLSSALDLLAITNLDVVEPLIACLSDADTDLRVQAALILGQRSDARAVPALMRALDDPDVNVRFHAIESLGRLRAGPAVDALLRIAESGEFFLAFPAVRALAGTGDVETARRLLPLLGDEMIGPAAVEALGELGDDTVAAPLAAALGQPQAPVDAIAEALASLFDRYERRYGAGDQIATIVRRTATPSAVQHLLDAAGRVESDRLYGIASVLGWLDGAAVQRALARLLGQPSVRAQIVEALVRYGAGVVDLLVEQLRAGDLETRQAAVVALGRIGDRRATSALVDALDDPELTVPAAGALARIGDGQAFDALMARIGDADAAVRQSVIAALNSIGHPDMPQRVLTLMDDPEERVRESATRIAGYFGYPQCLDAVLAQCADASEAVRRAAIEQLPMFDDARAAARLAESLRSDTPVVRAAAAAAFAHTDAGTAAGPLLAALDDDNPWVRYFAVRSLGAVRAVAGAAAVRDRLNDDQAPQVRLAAIEVLGRLDPASSLSALEPLALASDPDTARAAIRAMRHVESSGVHERLEALSRAREEWRRMEAIAALGERGGRQALPALEWVAAADESPDVTHAAIEGLAKIAARGEEAGSAAVTSLVALAAEASRREAAVAALSRLPVSRAPHVASGLDHPASAVRRAVVDALSRMRHVDATRWIERALEDGDASVREAAVSELRRLGSRHAARRLVILAQSDPDPAVRQAARMASDQNGGV